MKQNLPIFKFSAADDLGVDYALMATSAATGLIALLYLILI